MSVSLPLLTQAKIRVTAFNAASADSVYKSYTVPNTPFYFRLYWLTGSNSREFSQNEIIWNFGDGTKTVGPSAEHVYAYPGVYNVTATVFDTNGDTYQITNSLDTEITSVTAYNVIPDRIVFRNIQPEGKAGVYLLPAGVPSEPLNIIRYNSWQSDKILNDNLYTINLYASGSNSQYLSVSSYYTDKWSHLRTYFGFIERYQTSSGVNASRLVESTKTSSVSVFVEKYQIPGTWDFGLNLYNYQAENTQFAGTTGSTLDSTLLSFIDQTPSTQESSLIFLYATPNTTAIPDQESVNSNLFYNVSQPFQGYINVPSEVQYIKSIYNPASFINITSNGISVEGIDQTIGTVFNEGLHPFSIYPKKWANTKIPFVLTFKDNNNYTTKCYPPITGFKFDGTDPDELNTVSLGLYKYVDVDIFSPAVSVSAVQVESAFFTENPNAPKYARSGSYFCGVLTVPHETRVAVICAAALIKDKPKANIGAAYGYASQPGQTTIKRFNKRPIFTNCAGESLDFNLVGEYKAYTSRLSSAVSISYAPLNQYNFGKEDRVWIADADNDTVTVFTVSGTVIQQIDLGAVPTRTGLGLLPKFISYKGDLDSASPSHVAVDKEGNAWITLYDAVSTLKFNYDTLVVDAVAVPNLENIAYIDRSVYTSLSAILSGFAGENSLLPTCADTDSQNNLYVGYSHPVSGFIFKYNSAGVILSAYPLNPLFSIQDIIVDKEDNLIAFAANLGDDTPNSYDRTDRIYKWDSSFIMQNNFPIADLNNIGNITIDVDQNIWVTSEYSTITKINRFGEKSSISIDENYDSGQYLQPIGGMGADDEGYLWVIHNYLGKLYFIPLTQDLNNFVLSAVPSLDLPEVASINNDGSRALYNTVGDWTGIRWINKYVKVIDPLPRIVRGSSNLFDILENYSVINKVNENFDAQNFYQNLALQEVLYDKPILWESFIGQMLGNTESPPEILGKTIYEKIANIVGNVSDPDSCNVDALVSLFQQYGMDIKKFAVYPPALRRVLDLLSIKHSKLFGSPNTFNLNFGLSTFNPDLGKNLGDVIPVGTGTFIAGDPIVTFEKFSQTYTLVTNTIVPTTDGLSATAGQPFPLSGINNTWGWGLILENPAVSGTATGNYYMFYKYRPYSTGEIVDNLIDFNNYQTTITPQMSSYNEWTKFGGTMETVISRAFYQGLNLLNNE